MNIEQMQMPFKLNLANIQQNQQQINQPMKQSINKAQFCMSLLMPAFKTSPIALESSKSKHSIYSRLYKTIEN